MSLSATSDRPLYRQIADDIVDRIESDIWRPGDRLPSERSLCERYGVSQITVRRALREMAHVGHLYSRHGLGWFVSDSPRTPASGPEVGLVVPGLDWMTSQIVQGVASTVGEQGIPLRLVTQDLGANGLGEPPQDVAALLVHVLGPERDLASTYTEYVQLAGVPVLLLVRDVPEAGAPSASLDESGCMRLVTEHVLSFGHKRMAYAGSAPADVEGWRRYQGFSAALWEHGLELPLDWVFSLPLAAQVGGDGTVAEERFRSVFGDPHRPTALVCASDSRAAEAMLILRAMGLRCPEDVAVAGLGDEGFGSLLPSPLTTLRFDLVGLGQAAAGMAADLVAGRDVESAQFGGDMIVRKSCGATLGRQL